MDRFSYPQMGRRRPWVMAAQIGIVFAFLLLAVAPEPQASIYIVAGIGFLLSLCASTQDVAVDGMAIDVLPYQDRARANAFMFGGQLLGISVGASGGGYALNLVGLGGVAVMGSLATALIFLIPLLVRERPGERLLPWTPGTASQHALDLRVDRVLPALKAAYAALVAPVSLMLVVVEVLNRISDGLLFTVFPVFTVQELGWDDVRYNDWYAIAGVVAVLVGLAVSPFIDRFGTRLALVVITVVKVAAMLLVGLTALIGEDFAIVGLVFVSYACSHLFTIGIIATLMRVCRPHVAATQFAVYMALANLAYAGGSLVYVWLQPYFEASGLLVWSAGIMLVLLPMWFYVNRRYFADADQSAVAGSHP